MKIRCWSRLWAFLFRHLLFHTYRSALAERKKGLHLGLTDIRSTKDDAEQLGGAVRRRRDISEERGKL